MGGVLDLEVLHEDDLLLAVAKPPGRIVIPGRGEPERTIKDEAEARFGRLWVVHRLDRGTSGVLLFARTAEAHRAVNIAFEHHRVRKIYLALVRGSPDEARIDVPIAPARRGRMRPARPGDPRGKAAATYVRPIERFPPAPPLPALTLVEAVPETGRTHQIRVHLAHAGTPLAFDPDYGEAEALVDASGATLLARTPLHASRLELAHPSGGRRLVIEAPLPPDMARVLAAVRTPRP